MYEFFDHTADLGLRVVAPSLEQLFAEAAAGLFAMIVDSPPRVPEVEQAFRIEGRQHDLLLFDWLSELLFVFETRQLVLGDFHVQFDADGLAATARGEPLDLAHHRPLHEVKAITYHQLRVVPVEVGWQAEVIVDI